MEITHVDKIQTLVKIAKKEGMQALKLEDTLSISSDAHKKAEWVEKLKRMPDMRLDKIEKALVSDAFLNPAKVFAEVARQIQNS